MPGYETSMSIATTDGAHVTEFVAEVVGLVVDERRADPVHDALIGAEGEVGLAAGRRQRGRAHAGTRREHRQAPGDGGDRHHVGPLLHPQADALSGDVTQVPDDGSRGGQQAARQARARAEFEQAQPEGHAFVGALEVALRGQLRDEAGHGGLRHRGLRRELGDRDRAAGLLDGIEDRDDPVEHRDRAARTSGDVFHSARLVIEYPLPTG